MNIKRTETQVPLKDKPGGKIIGTAKIVTDSTGMETVEAEITDPTYDVIMYGFSQGSCSTEDMDG